MAGDLEKRRASKRAWVARNHERQLAMQRDWRERNRDCEKVRERQLASQRGYRERNREGVRDRHRAWSVANPEKIRAWDHARRARERGADGKWSGADVEAKREFQGGLCFYCSEPLGDDFHRDHYIPLAKGGTNYPTNLVLACPSCNCSKGAKAPWEWTAPCPLLDWEGVAA